MSRAKRLEPVQHLVTDAEHRLARSFAASERKVAEAEAKHGELERYRAEYQQQLAHRATQGMTVTDLRDYQAFLARLNEAIRQQYAVVLRARADRDAERVRWQEAARSVKTIDRVADRWRAEERHQQDRKEQRESDERAQRVRPKL
jgi:flagellar FliJ protein